MTNKMQLFTHKIWTCPYHQRLWIAMLEKGVMEEFDQVEVDPWQKPPELMRFCKKGIIPIVVMEDGISHTADSTVILEFLEEKFPDSGTKLMPDDPFLKSKIRYYMSHCNNHFVTPFYKFLLASHLPEAQEKIWTELGRDLQTFVRAMDPEGPFFLGKEFSLMDVHYAPYGLRYELVIPYYFPERTLDSLLSDVTYSARYSRWLNAVQSRPSVLQTIPKDMQFFRDSYKRYVDNTITGVIADQLRKAA